MCESAALIAQHLIPSLWRHLLLMGFMDFKHQREMDACAQTDNRQGPAVRHTELCAVLRASPDGRGV